MFSGGVHLRTIEAVGRNNLVDDVEISGWPNGCADTQYEEANNKAASEEEHVEVSSGADQNADTRSLLIPSNKTIYTGKSIALDIIQNRRND